MEVNPNPESFVQQCTLMGSAQYNCQNALRDENILSYCSTERPNALMEQ
jgi:hypothetical protein